MLQNNRNSYFPKYIWAKKIYLNSSLLLEHWHDFTSLNLSFQLVDIHINILCNAFPKLLLVLITLYSFLFKVIIIVLEDLFALFYF